LTVVPERAGVPATEELTADHYSVSPDYFQVMKIPIRKGRVFTETDTPDTPRVAIIGEHGARLLFGNDDPIGKRLRFGIVGNVGPPFEIVGVVGDVHQEGLDRSPGLQVYVAQTQALFVTYYRLLARTNGSSMAAATVVQRAFGQVDSLQPVYHIKPLDEYLAGHLAARSFSLWLFEVFGFIALTLGAVGVYGITSYTTALQAKDFAIRAALGAEKTRLIGLVLSHSVAMVAYGIVIGGAVSALALKSIQGLLFGVEPTDPTTMSLVAVGLVVIAVTAGLIPALQIVNVDPASRLRQD